ncbi:MAG: GntR family transcriptional regulator [Sciscionella sp.]
MTDRSAATPRDATSRGGSTPHTEMRTLQRPVPLRQAVYQAIAEMIITRALQPGEHLVENELAAQLGVSRQPVREALQRLQTEGWVDLRPALGAFVHVPTEDEADQLLAVRSLLETESARLAAKRSTGDHVARLWELQRVGEHALAEDNPEQLVTANADLHAYIVHMSGNVVLAEHILMVDRRVRWYYAPIARSRGSEAWDEHATLIEAIASKNGRRASDLMRKHTERTRSTYAHRQDGTVA